MTLQLLDAACDALVQYQDVVGSRAQVYALPIDAGDPLTLAALIATLDDTPDTGRAGAAAAALDEAIEALEAYADASLDDEIVLHLPDDTDPDQCPLECLLASMVSLRTEMTGRRR